MQLLKLYQADLSLDTLRSIRNDLAKYSHLKAYKSTFEELCQVINAREIEERRLKIAERKAG